MSVDFLLLENGDKLELESGTGQLLLQSSTGTNASKFLTLLGAGQLFGAAVFGAVIQ